MNQLNAINKRNEQELSLGISSDASWHEKYKNSAYIYIGGIEAGFSEGDIIQVFSQYGTVVDIDMPHDEKTGEKMGFAFLAYEDQRSTNLAVDNLNGIKLGDRLIRVDHKQGYFRRIKNDDSSDPPKSLLEIQQEIEAAEKATRREAKAKKREEKAIRKDEKKKRKLESIPSPLKAPKIEHEIPIGPQRPKSEDIIKSTAPILSEDEQRDIDRRKRVYNKEFWFDQNINVDPKKLTERQHYEQSYIYGVDKRGSDMPDARFKYDHLRYYDSLTHKDTEHKEKKIAHEEKMKKKINKY